VAGGPRRLRHGGRSHLSHHPTRTVRQLQVLKSAREPVLSVRVEGSGARLLPAIAYILRPPARPLGPARKRIGARLASNERDNPGC